MGYSSNRLVPTRRIRFIDMSDQDKIPRSWLKDQHKNTRHDAVDKMLEIRESYEGKYNFPAGAEEMVDRMMGAIMNLKQRDPIEDQ
jgi:hypothetical protein